MTFFRRTMSKIYRTLSVKLIVSLVVSGSAAAMPPHPDIEAKIDRGEIQAPFVNAQHQIGTPAMKINAPASVASPKITGTYKALCILADFSDKPAQANPFSFDTLIFAVRSGTVHDYYDEVSYGQLDMVTVNLPSALGWKRAPQTYAYYVNSAYGIDSPYPHNSQKLCEDLVDLVNSVVDFSQYDNNGDGYVDVVMIVHAGPGAEFTGQTTDMWSHKWSITPRSKDGVYISDYTVMPEYWSSPGDMTIGVFCHELGHALGLPDLYDTDNSSYGTGRWSLMSTGSWNGSLGSSPSHPDAWCRSQVGWMAPTNVAVNQTGVSIPNIETTARAYRLWSSGAAGNEYFLAENRQQTGYDAGLPGSGLLIWHIDESKGNNDSEWYPGHTSSGHYEVALEQADNNFQLEKHTSLGDASDPFPGSTNNTSFAPTSSPNSNSYADAGTFVAVTNISASGPTMTADFAVSLSAGIDDTHPAALPQLALGQNYPNPFNPSTKFSFSVPSTRTVEVNVYNLLGERVTQLAAGVYSAGSYTLTWDGTDTNGQKVSSGVYLYELTAGDEHKVKEMILLK
jgi:immune inhibitor A